MHYSLRRKKKRDARTFGACGESGEKWGRCGERSGLAGERHGSSMEAVWKQYRSGMEAAWKQECRQGGTKWKIMEAQVWEMRDSGFKG